MTIGPARAAPLLRALVHVTLDAVAVLDDRGRLLHASDALGALLGHPIDELVGHGLARVVEDLEELDASSSHAVRTVRGRHADGTLVPLELALRPLEVDGETYLHATLRDLTARTETERRLHEVEVAFDAKRGRLREVIEASSQRLDASEDFHRSVLDALSTHVAVLDSSLRIVQTNHAWRAFGAANGAPADGVDVGASYGDVLDRAIEAESPGAREAKAGLLELLDGTAEQVVVQYPCHSPDEKRWFVMRATRFQCERGAFLVVAHEDVTARQLAREQLLARESFLRAVIETAPEAILVIDEDERIEVLGTAPFVDKATLHGRSMPQVLSEEHLAQWRGRRDWAFATGESAYHEGPGSSVLGLQDRIFAHRQRRLLLPDAPPKLIVFTSDVTDARRAARELAASQEQLRQSQKMEAIGQLAGGMAHDFNNLITAIRYHVSFAAEALEPTHRAILELRQVELAAERATALTKQLLAFSRGRTVEPVVLDPGSVIEEALTMLRRLVGSRIRIAADLDPEARWVRADRTQLQQVITNLVLNARDAIESVGTVTVETRREVDAERNEHVAIAVSDDGAGMPPEVQARVFEPFFSTKGPAQGTGLGLAMVYGTVKQLGGSIAVSSELGRGSRFVIRLPRIAMSGEAARGTSTPPRGLSTVGEHILLVEDDPLIRAGTVRALVSAGYHVEAASPIDALRMLSDPAHVVDLLVSDVVMPEMTGPELVRRGRALRPDLRVLLLSGYTDGYLGPHDLTDYGFLAKPFSVKELLAKVRAVVGGSG